MKKGNAGYSLVEIVIAMALLAIITIPTYTCLNMSVKINAAADQLLKAQLAVSSAVETLMAEGIDPQKIITINPETSDKYYTYPCAAGISVILNIDEENVGGYSVTVTCPVGDPDSGNEVVVTTYILAAPPAPTETTKEVTGE